MSFRLSSNVQSSDLRSTEIEFGSTVTTVSIEGSYPNFSNIFTITPDNTAIIVNTTSDTPTGLYQLSLLYSNGLCTARTFFTLDIGGAPFFGSPIDTIVNLKIDSPVLDYTFPEIAFPYSNQ